MTLVAVRSVGPSGKIVAFEPNPTPRTMLERNLRGNNMDTVVVSDSPIGQARSTCQFRSRTRARDALNELNVGHKGLLPCSCSR